MLRARATKCGQNVNVIFKLVEVRHLIFRHNSKRISSIRISFINFVDIACWKWSFEQLVIAYLISKFNYSTSILDERVEMNLSNFKFYFLQMTIPKLPAPILE